MKILIISHEYPPVGGGGANACMYLAREYARAGHEIHIVTIWFEGVPEDERITEYEANIYIRRLRTRRKYKEHCGFGEMMDFLLKACRVADKQVKNAKSDGNPYDICHVFFGIPSGPIGYFLKKKYDLPYVIRFGGGDIPGFQERFTRVYKVIGPAIRLIWKSSDALVANSRGLKLLAEAFCDRYPILVFPNGVDTKAYYPLQDRDYTLDQTELLFVSRLIERKGLQFVIPGLKKLENETGKRVHLTIVGDGPYRETLESLTKKHEAEDMVTFIGQKDKSELLQFYQAADIFVFPSQKEGMPNAVLEAMASGLPVVMSPCQGSEELICGNGVICNSDLQSFNDTLLEVIRSSPEKLQKMSDCSRKRAEEMFSWRSVAEAYLRLFKSIVEQKGTD